MSYEPGGTFLKTFFLNGASGLADADSGTLSATLAKAGVDDGAVTLATPAHVGTGRYKVSGTIPGTYEAGDQVEVIVLATVAGKTGGQVIDLGELLQGVNVTRVNGQDATLLVPPIVVTGIVAPQGGVTVQVNGGVNGTDKTNLTLRATRLYPYTYTWTYYNLDSATVPWTQFLFTVKASPNDADTAALIAVQVTNPGSGTDGLTVLNGAAPSNPATASDGSLTITTANGNTVVTLSLLSRGMNLAAQSAFWELTRYSGGEGTKYLVDGGAFMVEKSLRQGATQN